jgi:hypothetical protein
MCIVCIDWIKGSLTSREAIKNMSEMVMSAADGESKEDLSAHFSELINKIVNKKIQDYVQRIEREEKYGLKNN